MIIKHWPPQKTPDLYSEELYNEICNDLGVRDDKQKGYFKETLERAALSLIRNWKDNPKRLTNAQEKYELKRLENSLRKAHNILDKLCNEEHLGRFRLFGGFKLERSEEEQKQMAILKEVFGDYHKNPMAISLALEALEKTALHHCQIRNIEAFKTESTLISRNTK